MKYLLKCTFGVLALACVAVIASGGDATISIIAYDMLVFAAFVLVYYLLYSDNVSFLIERSNNAN